MAGTNGFGVNQQNNLRQFRLITTPDQTNSKSGVQSFTNRTAEEFDYNSFAYSLLREIMGKVKEMLFEDCVAHELQVFYEQMQPNASLAVRKPFLLLYQENHVHIPAAEKAPISASI